MLFYRYSRWDGSQQVFPLSAEEVMDHLSDQMMGQGDLHSALRSLLQRGLSLRSGGRLSGLQDLLGRLRALRQSLLDRYDLPSVLEDIRRELEEIIRLEREGTQRRLREIEQKARLLQEQGRQGGPEEEALRRMERLARQSLEELKDLPQDPASDLQRLLNHEFLDPEAKERFDRLLQRLQEHLLNTHLRDLVQNLRNLGPGDLQALKSFLRDLNRLLEERAHGGHPDFSRFLERYRGLLGPDPPATLDDLVEALQHRIAQWESLLQSLSPEQRRQVQEALQSVFQDRELLEELARLAANLESLRPLGALRRDYPFHGPEPLTLEQAMSLMEALQRMDELERQLRRSQHAGSVQEVDPSLVEEVLGPEALQEVETLRRITSLLEEAGYVQQVGPRLELTPRGLRRLGQKALREIFAYIRKDRSGQHLSPNPGWSGERGEETKPYEYGDPPDIDLPRTLLNALFQEAPGVPLHLRPRDFEVYKPYQLLHASTVLLLDLSLSMAMRGNFLAAKKVALALDHLIRSQFPRDTLYIVGFSTYAREVKPEKLPYLTWDEVDPYTNIQHGLLLAQKLLARAPAGTKQVILISDGEPTAHFEGNQLFLQYPPSPRTLRETLKEVKRCTQKGIRINTFMLDRNSYLVDFVDQMSRINRGRVFYTSPDRLGQYLLVDYLTSRRLLLT